LTTRISIVSTLRAIAAIIALWGGTFAAGPTAAHELRPAIATATLDRSGAIELRVTLNLEAYVAGIGAQHSNTAEAPQAAEYDRLRAAAPEALRAAFEPLAKDFAAGLNLAFDGGAAALTLTDVAVPDVGDVEVARISTLVLTATAPAGAASMTFAAPEGLGATAFRAVRVGEGTPFFSAFQRAGEATGPIALDGGSIGESGLASFAKYARIGFEHIVPKGLDHILFVVGLFLLSRHLRPLMWQVTGFTLAHSVSLALGIYGVVRISPAIVEPLIAASIVFVAVENLFTDRLQRWRPAVVFGFGLLHGLGFAGVLKEIGLPSTQFVTALIGFNLGVELGQLAVVAACFLGVGVWFRHRHWYRRAVTMPASAAIALVATIWFVERIA
jgi:HupE / UreJ protein